MAPGVVEDAVQTNEPPSPSSGIFDKSTANAHWTPETVISTLTPRPASNTASPLPFLHTIERLKTNKREGWRRFGINHGESVADHMYRMSIITMLCPPSLASKLDLNRCTRMALVHDMAESLVGDITPVDGVSKTEKSRRETETMDYLCQGLLGGYGGGVAAKGIREVWQEYEDSVTVESKFVHDVDKMELLLQMLEYERERQGRLDLGEFAWVANRIVLPEVQAWAEELLEERRVFWEEKNGSIPGAAAGISEERKMQQEEYYGGKAASPSSSAAANGSANGTGMGSNGA